MALRGLFEEVNFMVMCDIAEENLYVVTTLIWIFNNGYNDIAS